MYSQNQQKFNSALLAFLKSTKRIPAMQLTDVRLSFINSALASKDASS